MGMHRRFVLCGVSLFATFSANFGGAVEVPRRWTTSTEKISEWVGVTGWVVRSPFASIKISLTSTWPVAATKTFAADANSDVFQAVSPLVQAPSLGFQHGNTSSLNKATYTYTIPPGPENLEFRIEKRVLWRIKTEFSLGYGPTGSAGIQNMNHRDLVLPTKELAEQVDQEYQLASRPFKG